MRNYELPPDLAGDLTDEQWDTAKQCLPMAGRGRPYGNLRATLDGILWILRTGSPWRKLPSGYGNWNSVYKRFVQWEKRGVIGDVAAALRKMAQRPV